MCKVILVDDEMLTREAIAENMPWEKSGFELVGTAENGKDAIELVEREQPDLVLTDICMPVMDGLELSAWLHEHYPKIRIIIISGYEDFEYAKRAIRYEVADYILKPVTSIELTEELQKVKEKIDESREIEDEYKSIRTQMERNVPVLRSHFLTRLLEGTYTKNDIDHQIEQLKINLTGQLQTVVMMETGDLPEVVTKYETSGEELVEFAVANIAEETAGGDPHILLFRNDKDKNLMIFAEDDEDTLHKSVETFCAKVMETIYQFMEIKICFFIGSTVEGVRNWSLSYADMLEAKRHKFLFDGQAFIYARDVLFKKDTNNESFIHQVDQLVLMIKLNNEEEIRTEVTDIFNSLRNSGKENRQLLLVIQNLVLMISMALEEHLREKQRSYDKDAFILRLAELKNLRAIEQLFLEFCMTLSEAIADKRESSNEKLAVRATDYIEKNYMYADISLNTVCEYLCVSTSYFSAIFKSATGETFIEALTRIRIEKARELLESSDMKNYEVALQVGYQDPHYFSSIFKKRTGMTPKEYTRKLRGCKEDEQMRNAMKRKRNLRGRINLSFLLIVAVAVVSFMILSINRSRQAIKDNSTEYTQQLIQLMNENIESYMENMENIAQIVMYNSDVRNFLKNGKDDKDLQLNRVEEQFATLKETRKDIYNIGIIGINGKYLINNSFTEKNEYARLEEQNWYKKTLKNGEAISTSHVQNIVYNEFPWVVTMGKAITDPESGDVIGVLFIDLNYQAISNLAENVDLGQKGYIFILDENGEIVYHPKQQLIYSGLWEEGFQTDRIEKGQSDSFEYDNRLYTYITSGLTDWTVVGVADSDEMLASTDDMIKMFYMIGVLLIGLAMIMAVLLTDKITLPLRRLQESMLQVESGNFEVDIVEVDSNDEISDLIRTFDIMIGEIKLLIDRNNKDQEEKRKNELNALQAQINPHFLYNTLDSIIWMAEGNNTKDVILMTAALARLFRKSISNKKELVTISEEIEYTKSYLTIQKMRYKGMLKYTTDVEPDIMNAEIIKLIVQPLVENAIYHGIKYKKGSGMIEIKAARTEAGIQIMVIDDGGGMTEEQLAHIFDERDTDQKQNGVGVLNVHKRIQMYYGEEYGLRFESKEGEGTTAFILIPDETGGAYGIRR